MESLKERIYQYVLWKGKVSKYDVELFFKQPEDFNSSESTFRRLRELRAEGKLKHPDPDLFLPNDKALEFYEPTTSEVT